MKKSLLDAVGNTPLIKLNGINIKLENLNPSGSVKDRIAKYIVEKAEKTGQLKKGYTIIEASSGNTGIAFSTVAAIKGYKMKVVIPRGLSEERYQMLKALNAQVVEIKKELCFTCAIKKAEQMGKRPKTYLPRQFSNPWNVEEHEKGMGKEVLKQVKGKIDCVVAGVGSGGTLIGLGKAIRKKYPKAKIIAMEPDECHLMRDSGIGKIHPHKREHMICKKHEIEGIADGLVPEIIIRDHEMIDEVMTIKSKEALKMANKLAQQGHFVGPSSGANYIAAQKLKRKHKNIITLFCDRGDRYLSMGIYK